MIRARDIDDDVDLLHFVLDDRIVLKSAFDGSDPRIDILQLGHLAVRWLAQKRVHFETREITGKKNEELRSQITCCSKYEYTWVEVVRHDRLRGANDCMGHVSC